MQARKAQRGLQDHKGRKDPLDQRDLKEFKALSGLLEHKDHKEIQVHRDQ
jgi:hypothetical protein